LEKLEALSERDQMEIIVLDRRTDETARVIEERFPRVILFRGLTGRSIPELRWQGIQAAEGEIVAILEDHCMVTPAWASEIFRRSGAGFAVVGGPVENGSTERLMDWAFFLAEYGPCMPPLPEGETEAVPGNNAAYCRRLLPLDEQVWGVMWESFLQKELRRRGLRIFLSKTMLIHHKKSFRLGEMLEQRFLYSRSFAAMRARTMRTAECWRFAIFSLALPPVLLWRIWQCISRKRRNQLEFFKGLPIIFLFVISWALGEMAGYVAGDGGSLARVE
jgi:hypothetical protein